MGRNAAVFRAWDRLLQRTVVFKTPHPLDPDVDFNSDELEELEALELEDQLADHFDRVRNRAHLRKYYTLVREGQLLAQVDHPNVISVIDVAEFMSGEIAVVLPFLAGSSLGKRELPERWEDVLEIVLQIGRGLAAIHAAGLLHRDFKPNNVVFGEAGRPVIVDLGLACRLDDADAMADWVGSMHYMAPEVYRRELRDQRDDLYAFCIVAFEAFYGRFPFASIDHRDRWCVRPVVREAGMSAAVHTVIDRGLAPDPAERWPDMETLLRELEVARDRSEAEPKRTPEPRRRWPRVAAWVAAAAAIGFALSVPDVRASECEELDRELEEIWDDEVREQLRDVLGTRKAGDGLQDWVSRWVAVRGQECEAARMVGLDGGPTPCSGSLRDRFESTVRAFEAPHLREQLSFATVLAELPLPEHCLDHPEAADWGLDGSVELRDLDVEVEALIRMGDLDTARARLETYTSAAREQGSAHGSARALFWRAELHRRSGRLDDAERDFEQAYLGAWELGQAVLGAEAQMKLAAIAGARGRSFVVDAHAHAALGVFEKLRPERTAELLRVQGLAIGGEHGVSLLARAVELREARLQEHPGTRELLSQARESYARGLLDVGRAAEALELLELALKAHQEEFGHGTWRVQPLHKQLFLAYVSLEQWHDSEMVRYAVLLPDEVAKNWLGYTENTAWFASIYARFGKNDLAKRYLHIARKKVVRFGLPSDVDRIDRALKQMEAVGHIGPATSE